jgi:hypothetical protein
MAMKKVTVFGDNDVAYLDYTCEVVSKEATKAVFATNTDPSFNIVVKSREGYQLGEGLCQVYIHGRYHGPAIYSETESEIEITLTQT